MKIRHVFLTTALGLSLMSGLGFAQGTASSAAEPAKEQSEASIQSTGTVVATDPAKNKVTLDHEPIPELGWPRMKMPFSVAPEVDLESFSKGDKVVFSLSPAEGGHKITRIAKE
ncbi:copper-binding protein [Marinobacter salicampi]|uniref:copper-binding protein n=1 Tax=Marinobacter salicampi TaxID=435907 RepID=UPI0014093C1A|nr:copper-binding protein [Marinobacter salicampi]